MSDHETRTSTARRSRERWAMAVLLLFPLLVAGGFVLPEMVRKLAIAAEGEVAPLPLSERLTPYDKQPLVLVPRASEEYALNLIHPADVTFERSSFAGRDLSLLSDQVAEAGPSKSDEIILDDVPDFAIEFPDPLGEEEPDDFAMDERVDPLCGVLWGSNCVRFDDFIGVVVDVDPVPEPSSGMLGALGLAALAMRQRIRRR